MIQTKNCLYCGTPFIGTSFTCSRWDCPSKQIQTCTYCSPPCDKLRELDARVKELEDESKRQRDLLVEHDNYIASLDAQFKDHINKYHFIQYPPKTAKGRFDPDTHLPYDAKPTPTDNMCEDDHKEWTTKHPDSYSPDFIIGGYDRKPTPTDEEMTEKLISEYLFLFNARFDLDVKDSEDVRDILRQLIAEVRGVKA